MRSSKISYFASGELRLAASKRMQLLASGSGLVHTDTGGGDEGCIMTSSSLK